MRAETTPDDIHGVIEARGVLTAHGGMTSHAAVVARGMGKPCVAGCDALTIDLGARTIRLGDHELAEGDVLTIDGGTGDVIVGDVPLVPPQIDENFQTLLGWADELRRLRVRANADTPEDAAKAREFGAEGIGLCRTEHMFMADDRLPLVRAMILASSEEERRTALDKLLPFQQRDFEGILAAMAGLPGDDPAARPAAARVPALARGSRRRRTWPGGSVRCASPTRCSGCAAAGSGSSIPRSTRCRCGPSSGPLSPSPRRAESHRSSRSCTRSSGSPRSSRRLRRLTLDTASAELEQADRQLEYQIGTMIELPRACVRADEIAGEADFFSFGTNDLTQTTLGFSRDDAEGKFLTRYLEDRILDANPFETLDAGGVGDLMRIGVERARGVKPDIKLGICGEHGGDARSVAFCHELGLAYVSCSPYRVPLARLAAAQAALAERGVTTVQVGG